jgi:uroporphyrinogen decarboxylase
MKGILMAISEKENILRHYTHVMPEHYPDLDYLHTMMGYGFLERPLEPEIVALLDLKPDKYAQYTVSRKDWFGIEYVYEAGVGSMPDPHRAPVVTDICKWREQVVFPDLDAYDWALAAEFDHVDRVDREHKAFSVLVQAGIYERFHSLLGMEEALVSLLVEPEASAELLAAITEHKLALYRRIIENYQPDILRQHDDYGAQANLQMSPDLWRQMIKPNLARVVDLVHSLGVRYEQHSCGMVEAIIPDFVELGIDSWQGMHINDVLKLKKMTGDKLNYHMSLPIQDYVARDGAGNLTEEELRREVRELVTACATCTPSGFYFAVTATADPQWWGTAVLNDELRKVGASISYQ